MIVTSRPPRKRLKPAARPVEIDGPHVVKHLPKWQRERKVVETTPEELEAIIDLFERMGLTRAREILG